MPIFTTAFCTNVQSDLLTNNDQRTSSPFHIFWVPIETIAHWDLTSAQNRDMTTKEDIFNSLHEVAPSVNRYFQVEYLSIFSSPCWTRSIANIRSICPQVAKPHVITAF